MLANTVADVASRVVSEAVSLGLEVDGVAPASKVGRGKIGGSRDELGNGNGELGEEGLGKLAGSDGGVGGGEGGESLLPSIGKLSSETALDVSGLLGVLGAVLLEELVPGSLGLGSLLADLGVNVLGLLGHGEELLGVEAELLLDLDGVVLLEGVAVNAVSSLVLRSESNGSAELDQSGLGLLGLSLSDGLGDATEVVVSLLDDDDLPVVSLEALGNILGESDGGGSVDGDLVVIVDGDEVAELKVTARGSRSAK